MGNGAGGSANWTDILVQDWAHHPAKVILERVAEVVGLVFTVVLAEHAEAVPEHKVDKVPVKKSKDLSSKTYLYRTAGRPKAFVGILCEGGTWHFTDGLDDRGGNLGCPVKSKMDLDFGFELGFS